MPKANIAVARKPFLGNNSGKPEPIGSKFYTETSVQPGTLPTDFRALRQTGAKWRQKGRIFRTVCH